MRTQRSQFDTFYFSDFVWGGAAAVDNLFESPGDDNSRAIPHDFPGARRYLFSASVFIVDESLLVNLSWRWRMREILSVVKRLYFIFIRRSLACMSRSQKTALGCFSDVHINFIQHKKYMKFSLSLILFRSQAKMWYRTARQR